MPTLGGGPLGWGSPIGQPLQSATPRPGATAFAASATVSGRWSAAFAASATLAASSATAFAASAVVAPLVAGFSINGVAIPAPEQLEYDLPPQVGYDVLGTPIVQGWTTLVMRWSTLPDADAARIQQLYRVNTPVTLTYLNEHGNWVSKQAMWTPEWGSRQPGFVHSGVSHTFTHLSAD